MHNIECNFLTVHPYTLIREYAKTIIHILYISYRFSNVRHSRPSIREQLIGNIVTKSKTESWTDSKSREKFPSKNHLRRTSRGYRSFTGFATVARPSIEGEGKERDRSCSRGIVRSMGDKINSRRSDDKIRRGRARGWNEKRKRGKKKKIDRPPSPLPVRIIRIAKRKLSFYRVRHAHFRVRIYMHALIHVSRLDEN